MVYKYIELVGRQNKGGSRFRQNTVSKPGPPDRIGMYCVCQKRPSIWKSAANRMSRVPKLVGLLGSGAGVSESGPATRASRTAVVRILGIAVPAIRLSSTERDDLDELGLVKELDGARGKERERKKSLPSAAVQQLGIETRAGSCYQRIGPCL